MTFGFRNKIDLNYEKNNIDLELRIGWPLVGDELDLHRLHGGDGQHGLGHASAQTTEEPGTRGEIALLNKIMIAGIWRLQ
jgi:hypothetical protein